MLELRELMVNYGDFKAVKNLSLNLERGDAVGLAGRNGAGKTSTLKGVLGLVDAEGDVLFKGQNLRGLETHRRIARGIGYSPQDRLVFRQMTVKENFRLVASGREEMEIEEYVLDLFPGLEGRLNQNAGSLSGGERAMVAIARCLIADPELLLLDEPTEGLMPEIEERLLRVLNGILTRGKSVLIAEQNFNYLRELASSIYQLEAGRVKRVVES